MPALELTDTELSLLRGSLIFAITMFDDAIEKEKLPLDNEDVSEMLKEAEDAAQFQSDMKRLLGKLVRIP